MSSKHKDDAPDAAKATPPDMAGSSPPQQPRVPAKVDIWFDAQLMQLYGEILDEPIPDDLLELVRKLRPST